MMKISPTLHFGIRRAKKQIRKLPREFVASALQVHMPSIGLSGDQDKVDKALKSLGRVHTGDRTRHTHESALPTPPTGDSEEQPDSDTNNPPPIEEGGGNLGSHSDGQISKYKNQMHKRLWNAARRSSRHWDMAVKRLESANLPFDEVTGTLLIHGSLLYKSHQDALDVLQTMKSETVHPALIRYNARLITIHSEFSSFGVKPAHINWLKVMRSAWFVASFVKGRRERFIQRSIGHGIHNLSLLWSKGYDPLLTNLLER